MNRPSDNPVQEGERQATATRPLVLLEKFNGTGNFNEWISHFEGIAAINKWTDNAKSLWLKVWLTDKAHVALMRLPNDVHESYASLKAALKERFEPSSKQEVYKTEFESCRKRSTESWGDFGDELLQLVDKASQEKINISACVNGIPYINSAREMGVHERIASVT